jgi:hypothetical protein
LLLLTPVVLVIPLVLFIGRRTPEEKTSFYKEPMKASDVWRLPVVEPHELITAYCCQSWNYQQDGENFTADSVNYAKGYILSFGYPGTYGLFDTRRRQLVRMATYQQFGDSVRAKGIVLKLYKTETVYTGWLKTGQLPWAAEILALAQDK